MATGSFVKKGEYVQVSYKSKAPTGLAIKRQGKTFTCSWKIGDDDYGAGVTCEAYVWITAYTTIKGKLVPTRGEMVQQFSKKLAAGATSTSITIDTSKFYPDGRKDWFLNFIEFYVKGCRKNFNSTSVSGTKYASLGVKEIRYTCDPSEWTRKVWMCKVPNKFKTLTASLAEYNRAKFTWEMNSDDEMDQWARKYKWEAILVKNSTVTDGSKIKFNSSATSYLTGTGTAYSGTTYIPSNGEDTHLPGWKTTDSYTRWVRYQAQGPRGEGEWRYAKHIYAMPYKATGLSGKVTIEQTTTLIYLKWKLGTPADHPVDEVLVQYNIGVPDPTSSTKMYPPEDGWTDSPVGEIRDTKGNQGTTGIDGVTFRIDEQPTLDQCVWARVQSKHDEDRNVSDVVRLRTENLKAPTGLSVTVNSGSHTATVNATNASENVHSIIIVRYFDKTSYKNGFDIAQFPSHSATSVSFQCPNWGSHEIYFQVYAVVPSKITTSKLKGNSAVNVLTVESMAKSAMVTEGGKVPTAPQNVALSTTDISGTINVKWSWPSNFNWEHLEMSWADHEDAWESTSGPSTYEVSRLQTPSWNISGLDIGKIWYVRLRYGDDPNTGEGQTVWGAYSETESIDLSVAPDAPVLHLSSGVTTVDSSVRASWTYYSEDGSTQESADLYLLTDEGNYERLYHVQTAQAQNIFPSAFDWETGNTYKIVLRVTSSSGKTSEWSEPVGLSIADPVTVEITQDSLDHNKEIVIDPETGETTTVTALTEMPLTVTVSGAGVNGRTVVSIIRLDDYHILRPDEKDLDGFEGEMIAIASQTGETQMTISNDSLIGRLDDGAKYRLIATVTDNFDQTASDSIDFEVHWDHQALMPEATVDLDEENGIAILSPVAPTGTVATDVCDIYRLSADKPELVYSGATFGEAYVDPYPTLGDFGGYRFVFRTKNDDYITADNTLAWLDLPLVYKSLYQFIDFGEERLSVMYNVSLSSSWTKDFKETKYLGGAVQGDWNPAVSRTGSVSAVVITAEEEWVIEQYRRLVIYPGICRVRTIDGSNYTADVQGSESRGYEELDLVTNFSLNITRVDPETTDGLTYEEWAEYNEGVIRKASVVFYEEDSDNVLSYTISYSVYSSNTETSLLITKVAVSGTTTQGTSTIQITADGTQLYTATGQTQDVSVSLRKVWSRTTVDQSKQISLNLTIGNDIDETAYAYVYVPALTT